MLKKRDPWIALFLGLCGPGLGQVYNGRGGRAFFCCVLLSILSVACIGGAMRSFSLGAALVGLILVLHLVILVDAFLASLYSAEFQPKIYNRWYVYPALIVGLLFARSAFSSYVKVNYLEAFKFASSSMEPVIVPGDRVVVDKTFFKKHSPSRGDVASFILSENEASQKIHQAQTNTIKRIAAIAGDTVQVHGQQLLINGQPCHEPFAVWRRGGLKSFEPATVPPGHVFLLGDNRDYSNDARSWRFPFVETSRLTGKVMYVYWPLLRMGTVVR